MYLKNLGIFLSIILISSGSVNANPEGPVLILKDCKVPIQITEKITRGIQFALDNKAAFDTGELDLHHVHLLIKQDTRQKLLSRDKIGALELMNYTEAMLFHSQEDSELRNFLPDEVRKRRNIFFDFSKDEISILDTEKYPVEPEFLAIWPEKDLGFTETFQVTFETLPYFNDQKCKLPILQLRNGKKVAIINVIGLRITEPGIVGEWITRICFCSGKVD